MVRKAVSARARMLQESPEVQGMLGRMKTSGGIRTSKVLGTKDAITSNVYEDDKKLDAAIEKLLDDLEL